MQAWSRSCLLLTALAAVSHLQLAPAKHFYGLHFAPTPELPVGHPPQTADGALGLPEGCITYTERYAMASNLTKRRSRGWNANLEHKNSKYVVLTRVHYGMPFPKDLILNLRALMEESSQARMHFYLLYEDSPLQEPGTDDSPQKLMAGIPVEFHPVTFLFDSNDVHNLYPLVHKFEPHIRDYLPTVYFLHRFQHYEFAWVLEFDVRYTGAHWGRFFNIILNLAISQLEDKELSPEEQIRVAANTALPPEPTALPDLILFGDNIFSDTIHKEGEEPWWPRDTENWNFTEMSLWSVMEMAWSRRLANALHENSVAGLAGYLEEFIPSTATARGLDIVMVPVPDFEGQINHCCTDYARDYYRDWYRSGQCRAYGLIHPVKVYNSHGEMAAATADLNHYQNGAVVLQSGLKGAGAADHHERGRRNATATASNAAAIVGGRRDATAAAFDATATVGGRHNALALATATGRGITDLFVRKGRH